jgi:predicted GNAT family acetyltransferase
LTRCTGCQEPITSAPIVCREGKVGPLVANVEFIFVDRKYRGKGIGRQLLAALARVLVRQGTTWALAHISAQNDASVRMFRSAGWHVFRVTDTSLRACKELARPL